MRRFMIGWLSVVPLLAGASLHASKTVTVGGVQVKIPDGWVRADIDGRITLVPSDLPRGATCSLTLLGGEAFNGAVQDRLAADWKELTSDSRIVWDDQGKLVGAGKPVQVATRAGTVELKTGVTFHVWMVILHANGRIERMILGASTPEAFAKYIPPVMALIGGTKLVAVVEPVAPGPDVAATAGAFGHMRYTVPRGWTERRYATGVIHSLDNPPDGEQLEVQLMMPSNAPGTLSDAMASSWDEACTQLGATTTRTVNNTAYTAEAGRKSFKGWDYIRANGIITSKANEAQYYLELYVIKVNDRFERLLVLSLMRTHNVSRYSLYNSPVHQRTIREFVFALQFDDWKDAVVEPASLKGEGIIGVWQGISMFGGAFKAAYAIFYSNGQVFFGSRFPLSGCDEQNTWIEAEQTPRYWGTYTFQNGGGVIKMPFGDVPIKAKGNDLVITTSRTDHTFVRVPSVDGATFDGTYVMAEAYETIPVITFTAGGRFKDEGALRVLDHDFTNVFGVAVAPGAGAYVVRNHTITFRYDDGRQYRLAYPGVAHDKSEPSPRHLVLSYNEDTLQRK